MQYVFILGHNPKLSIAEISAVFPEAKTIDKGKNFLILDNLEIDCQKILDQLGGTIKIGKLISERISAQVMAEELIKEKKEGKLNFGISGYLDLGARNMKQQLFKLGLEVKKILKANNISSRLVMSRESVLSSVVVTKNKCREFLVLNNKYLAKTCAVQKFEDYSKRDYGRPKRDLESGMMPPKLAKIMINLAQVDDKATILDPFCGSGTILQEAFLLGFESVLGCDVSSKAVVDSIDNINWLKGNSLKPIKGEKIFQCNVIKLSNSIKARSIDAIITEPFLGPPLKGGESLNKIKEIIRELTRLYLSAFSEFKKVLKPGRKVVIIFPVFLHRGQFLKLEILSQVRAIGFKEINEEELIYSRSGQKILREVLIFKNI